MAAGRRQVAAPAASRSRVLPARRDRIVRGDRHRRRRTRYVEGWACDPDFPGASAPIQISVGGALGAAGTSADRHAPQPRPISRSPPAWREAVAAECGGGSGRHGFRFALLTGASGQGRLRLRHRPERAGRAVLAPARRQEDRAAPPAAVDQPAARGDLDRLGRAARVRAITSFRRHRRRDGQVPRLGQRRLRRRQLEETSRRRRPPLPLHARPGPAAPRAERGRPLRCPRRIPASGARPNGLRQLRAPPALVRERRRVRGRSPRPAVPDRPERRRRSSGETTTWGASRRRAWPCHRTRQATEDMDLLWTTGKPPAPGITVKDDFSARFEGDVVPPLSGDYSFTAETDRRVKIFLGGKPVSGSSAIETPGKNCTHDICAAGAALSKTSPRASSAPRRSAGSIRPAAPGPGTPFASERSPRSAASTATRRRPCR